MDPTEIDSGARVSPKAELGVGVRVGFGAVIEAGVQIGDRCVIDHHAVIRTGVSMGSGNHVDSHAVLGGRPQDLKYNPKDRTFVRIGNDNIFREGVTVSKATTPEGATVIGSRCYLMNNAHLAHDCTLEDGVIMATGVALAGHVEVGAGAFFGGGTMAHQWCRIGAYAMVAGLIAVRKDVLPFTVVAGEPVRHYRANTLGLERANLGDERKKNAIAAVDHMRRREPLDDLPQTPEIVYLRRWLSEPSKRGRYPFVRSKA